MIITEFILVYFVVWWIVLLFLLPVGVKVEEVEKGHASSAPTSPKIKEKMIAASVIAFVITGGFLLYKYDVLV